MYLQSLFTPGRFINAALCKALQVSEKIFHVDLRLSYCDHYVVNDYC